MPRCSPRPGSTCIYALVLGYQITGREDLKTWALAGGDNFANIFDRKGPGVPPDRRRRPYRHRYRAQPAVDAVGRAMGTRARSSRLSPPRHRPRGRPDPRRGLELPRRGARSADARRDPACSACRAGGDSSTWARGQGWAMLGFAHAYEASGRQLYIDAAKRAADWYVDHAPAGLGAALRLRRSGSARGCPTIPVPAASPRPS